MRVTVTLTLDIDPDAWDDAYGTGTKAADVRADVRAYVLNAVQDLKPVEYVRYANGATLRAS